MQEPNLFVVSEPPSLEELVRKAIYIGLSVGTFAGVPVCHDLTYFGYMSNSKWQPLNKAGIDLASSPYLWAARNRYAAGDVRQNKRKEVKVAETMSFLTAAGISQPPAPEIVRSDIWTPDAKTA